MPAAAGWAARGGWPWLRSGRLARRRRRRGRRAFGLRGRRRWRRGPLRCGRTAGHTLGPASALGGGAGDDTPGRHAAALRRHSRRHLRRRRLRRRRCRGRLRQPRARRRLRSEPTRGHARRLGPHGRRSRDSRRGVINDSFGHSTGDLLLQTVVTVIKSHARSTDVVARSAGTKSPFSCPKRMRRRPGAAITKTREGLVLEMGRRGWPLSPSP